MRDRNPGRLIVGALDTLIFGGDRTLRIVGESEGTENAVVEVLMPERPLRAELLRLLALDLRRLAGRSPRSPRSSSTSS